MFTGLDAEGDDIVLDAVRTRNNAGGREKEFRLYAVESGVPSRDQAARKVVVSKHPAMLAGYSGPLSALCNPQAHCPQTGESAAMLSPPSHTKALSTLAGRLRGTNS